MLKIVSAKTKKILIKDRPLASHTHTHTHTDKNTSFITLVQV